MTEHSLPLAKQRNGYVPKSRSSTNGSNVCRIIHGNVGKQLHIHDQMAVLSADTMGSIAMTPAFGSDIKLVLDSTSNGSLNL